tara:strand:- start:222 stop:1073 length:852 start_codon:yes stop_codon:yes gene_type:complete
MKNIGIIGNGFVGSAMAAGFGLHANVKIYDKDPRRGCNTLDEVVNNSEFIFVCVPTPMRDLHGGDIDLAIMNSVFKEIDKVNRRDDNIFVIKSTVIPGTTQEYARKYPNLKIVFNPEFLTERNANLDFINASRIILGGAAADTEKVKELYIDRFPYTRIIETDSGSAEFTKYMCNCFFATKISYMNEMRQAVSKLNFSWEDIMEGFISDGRIGNSHLDVPGHDGSLGYGGKCFPKDINAFIGFFNKIEIEPKILNASWSKNLEVRDNLDWGQIEGAVSTKEEE